MIVVNTRKLFRFGELWQGDDWNFYTELDDIDPTTNTLTYVIKINSIAPFSFSSTPFNGLFSFSVPAATTSTFLPGQYYVSAYLIDANGLKTTLASSEIEIKPNLSLEGTGDPRSAYKQALDTVEQALALSAGSDVVEYTIGGQTSKMDRASLLKLRAFYLHRVRMEDGHDPIGRFLFDL